MVEGGYAPRWILVAALGKLIVDLINGEASQNRTLDSTPRIRRYVSGPASSHEFRQDERISRYPNRRLHLHWIREHKAGRPVQAIRRLNDATRSRSRRQVARMMPRIKEKALVTRAETDRLVSYCRGTPSSGGST